jgi:hypothetical protein
MSGIAAFAFGLEFADVGDALLVDVGLVGQARLTTTQAASRRRACSTGWAIMRL